MIHVRGFAEKSVYEKCMKCINGCGDIFRALSKIYDETFKSALPGLTQIMATESPLKMIKNAFYFILKAIFVLKIFKFFPCFFGHLETRKA